MARIHLKDYTINHVEVGQEKMLGQFNDSPNVIAFMKTYLGGVQEVEDAILELLTERGVYTAVGVQLDVIGYLLNVDRLGLEDFLYRRKILTAIYVQSGNATAPTIQEACMQLTASPVAKAYEHFPASLGMACSGLTTDVTISEVLDSTTAVSVKSWYYEMGRTMKWRGADILREFDTLVTNTYPDPDAGIHEVWHKTDEVDSGKFDLNTKSGTISGASEPAVYLERPMSERGTKRRPRKITLVEPQEEVSNQSGFVEDLENDPNGVHAEYYQLTF